MSQRNPQFKFGIAVALVAAWSGCAVHQPLETVRPAVPAKETYAEASSEVAARDFAGPWWAALEDPTLTALIDESLSGNLELQQLSARIRQADALLRQAGARLFPALDGSAELGANWRDLDQSAKSRRTDSGSLGTFLSWEADIWGRLRSAREARRLEAEATLHDWEGGRLLLSASVAETYLEILEQQNQLRLIDEQIAVGETLLELTQLRFGQGQASIVDVLQQQEQVASIRSRRPGVESRLAEAQYALDVFLGRTPGDHVSIPGRELASPAPPHAPGPPSQLLTARPDLRAAEAAVRAVDYRVAEALADRLPHFVIGGSLSAVGDPTLNSLMANTVASLAGPLFDAGERRAVVEQRRAELDEALAVYSQTYLEAVGEVESALVRERKQAETVQLVDAQLKTAHRLLTETRNRYSQGLTDYLPVLAAVRTEQDLQRDLISARRTLLSYRVLVYRSLGGPMTHPSPEKPRDAKGVS